MALHHHALRASSLAQCVSVVAFWCVLAEPADPGEAAGSQVIRISLSGQIVDGTRGHQGVRGDLVFGLPTGRWRRTGGDRAPEARFRVRVSPSCSAKVLFTARAIASGQDAGSQVKRYTRGAKRAVAGGRRKLGAWRIVEYAPLKGERQFYGIAAIRLTHARWLHLRVFPTLHGRCADSVIGQGFVSTVTRVLRMAQPHATLVTPAK